MPPGQITQRERPVSASIGWRDQQFLIEQCEVTDLAGRFGTPLNVISERALRENFRRISRAFAASWPHGPVMVLPSIKANYVLAVRRVLSAEGAGCDTFGASELQAALRGGVAPDMISVNGSAKDEALIATAVDLGARITIDSADELHMTAAIAKRAERRARIRLRLRPDYEALDERSELLVDRSISEAANTYKPGIEVGEAKRLAAEALADPNLDLLGLMVHLGRHSASVAVWRKAAASMAQAFAEVAGAVKGWRPTELDIGGGFPAPSDPTSPTGSPAPAIEEIAASVGKSLSDGLRAGGVEPAGITLQIEPGRSLFADAGVHLTRIRHVKEQTNPAHRRWIETDTTEMFLPDLLIEHAHFKPEFVTGDGDVTPADLVGTSCGFDILAEQIPAPAVSAGDLVVFLGTGAYQDAASANFNALPRPGTVLVDGEKAEWIKRPETIADVFARDLIPDRLA